MKPTLHKVLGQDKYPHAMTLRRKAAQGVNQFADVTKPMSAEKLRFVRNRAIHVTREAIQRQWILLLPFTRIKKRVLA